MPTRAPVIYAASFRDPAGYIFHDDGVLKRAVTAYGFEDYKHFISSGLYAKLVAESLIVRHEEESNGTTSNPGIAAVLVPEPIKYISYPYEWSFGQLRDAALLTLRIQALALQHGMSLKDASGFNVQFQGPHPIFIDTLSFERNTGGPWPAYNQFCRHFLAPLLLMKYRSPSFNHFWKSSLDGFPLDFTSSLLPKTTYLSFGILIHLHLHAKSQRKYAASGKEHRPIAVTTESPDRKAVLTDSLKTLIEGLTLHHKPTEWLHYYGEAAHYSNEAEQAKKAIVAQIIDRISPRQVYDFGGNIGQYSRIATTRGIDCVCFDIDPLCVHHNYETSKASNDKRMLPLLMDLTNPSPGLGFSLKERQSLLERPQAHLLLALALIHHLRITGNIPFQRIAEFFAGFGEYLLLEYVPLEDQMVQVLLTNRKNTFLDYTLDGFVSAFQEHFETVEAIPVPQTARTLYLFRRHGNAELPPVSV